VEEVGKAFKVLMAWINREEFGKTTTKIGTAIKFAGITREHLH
jgi:hypothetical protein